MSFDFTNQYISQSYQRVLQTDGSKVYDGTGSLAILEYSGSFVGDGSGLTNLNIDTGSFTTTSSFNQFTSSYNSGSFSGSFVGDGSGLSGVGSSLDYSPAARIWFLG
jgi:hypothetical protein